MSDTPRPDAQHAVAETACACATRRDAFRAAGAAGLVAAGASSLAACGGASGDAASTAASAAASAGSEISDAIAAADVPVGGGTVLERLKVVVTQPTDGDFKAFSAVCPHQGCTVSTVAEGVITCPCHGSQFDISTGDVVTGPATTGLPAKTVTVGADGLTIT